MTPALPDLLPIAPFTCPVRGEAILPGSKSLTNRALLLAALAREPATLTGALFSEDTQLMAEALRQLGFTVAADGAGNVLTVSGQSAGFSRQAPVEIFVGLAGTAARFLTALCAAAPRGVYRLDGVPQMRKRPMKALIEALRGLGADLRCTGEEGFFPLEIHARGLLGGAVKIDASESSQMLSALFMVAPLAQSAVEIQPVGGVRWPFVQMTARLMEEFGLPAVERRKGGVFFVPPAPPHGTKGGVHAIEADATAASYFLALPFVVGGKLALPGLKAPGQGLQGDTAFADVMRRAGLSVAERGNNPGLEASFVAGAPRRGVTQDFSEFSDTFLTLAAVAPLLDGPTRITGIAHTRKQETDRVAGMARELRKLGQEVAEEADALTITPRPLQPGQTIETYGDHRFAMSFGILGCHDLRRDGRPWLTIKDPACCAKTFPGFFGLLEDLRQKSLAS
ncbi:MAG TPA: 3-phosphoshikimate 1-carboxyvinyltransferase [Opitutaceae bacterium]|nr:3-phosphoshikimate 1-carboxyvinyltransferase [Opitutaceae bacterium]